MCDKALDDRLAALKFIPDWFVTSKMILKFFTALYADDGLLIFHEDSSNVTLFCNELSIFSVKLNNIYLDNNFNEDYSPQTFGLE